MTEPRRWSEAGDAATHSEQRLVRAGQDLPMPAHEKQVIWNQILGALPTAPPLPADGNAPLPLATKAATVSGSGALWPVSGAKTLGLLVAVSAIVAGSYHWLKSSSSSPRETPRIIAPGTAVPIVSVAPVRLPAPAESAVGIETPASAPTATSVPAPSHASQLREESLAVMAARQALRSNDAGKALHLLEQAQQRFKRGALIEEREALMIEALARTGQSARASARALAFVTRYPRSPHAADMQRFINE